MSVCIVNLGAIAFQAASKVNPLARPILAFIRLMCDGSEFGVGAASAWKTSLAIPALEAALGSQACGASKATNPEVRGQRPRLQ